jgi:hypothetical protein
LKSNPMNEELAKNERGKNLAALYLYCLREYSKDSSIASIKSIDGEGEVFVIPFRELEAIASEVSLDIFTSEEIQRKAREDLNWIKEKALTHARVIQEAMGKDHDCLAIIPMKFGIIFEDVSGLEKVLHENYSKFLKVLERVRGKQEWSVKLYLKDREVFEEKTKEKNDFIKEKEREIASLPEGMAYFMEEELKAVISKEVGQELDKIAASLHETLGRQAVDSVRCKILGKELTRRLDPMILNMAYLLQEEKIGDFKIEVKTFNKEMKALGLSAEHSGPWPPYNFASW